MNLFPDRCSSLSFRKAFLDALIVLFIYIFCVSLPGFLVYEQNEVSSGLRLLFIAPCLVYLISEGFHFNYVKPLRRLLCIPLFFVCFGNAASLLFSGSSLWMEEGSVLRNIAAVLATAISEELIYRFALIDSFEKNPKSKKVAILLSSVLFGISHLLPILGGGAVIPCLIQAGYTFLLGLLLGVSYKVGGLVISILVHFVFNFLQNELYLSSGGGNWDSNFIIFNLIFALIAGFYAVFLFFKFIFPTRK